ncbi:MAG: carboxypeptidase-like regulatory domain-containing protein [Opitutaceae bacterium]|jgi:hypothetical protein
MLSGGNLVGGDFRYSLEQVQWQGRTVWKLRQQFTDSGKIYQQTTFLVDPNNEDALVFSELTFPSRNPDVKSQWIAQEFGRSPGGILYPARYQRGHARKNFSSMEDVRVVKLDVLDGLPAGLTERPQSADAPYLSKTGRPVVHTQLAVDYVNAKESGGALPPVTVVMRVNQSNAVQLQADSQGHLIISLPPEEITYLEVRAKAAGFAPQVVRWRKQGDPLKLPERYSAKLWPASPVSGKVIDESGRPVAGAEVQLWLSGVGRGNYVFGDFFDISGLKMRTDSDGIWTSKDFPDDLRGLSYRVSAQGYPASTDSGSADFRSFAKVPYSALRDGSWVVTLRQGVPLSGIVSDISGAPVSGARLVVGRDAWGTNLPVVTAGARGGFELNGLGVGPIVLTAESPLHKPQSMELTLPLAAPLAIRLDKGNVLRGRVVDIKGKPCAGLNVGVDTWKNLRTLNFTTQTDDEGRFEWQGAPDEPVSYSFGGCQNREFLNGLWLKAGADEQIVVMKPALRLNAKVIDAVTKLPIESFRLTSGRVYENGDPYWEKTSTKSYENGAGVWETGYMGGRLAFLIEAEGYAPLQTPDCETQQTEITATYELKPVSGNNAAARK